MNKACTHYFEKRPWGSYETLCNETELGFQVKRLVVNPQSRLSLQKHSKRRELWSVVQGNGVVTLDDNDVPVKKGSMIEIPMGSVHRMSNIGETPLIFVEVQLGDYLGEDDIVRLEDDYNRA